MADGAVRRDTENDIFRSDFARVGDILGSREKGAGSDIGPRTDATRRKAAPDCHCVRLRAGYGEVEHIDHLAWMGQAYVGEYKLVLTHNNSKTAGACVLSDAWGPFKGV